MDCRHFDEYISPYLDQILDEQDKEGFEKHLRQCSECKKKLGETQKVVSLMKELDEEPLPQDFRDNLFKKIEGPRKPNNLYLLRWIGAMAGVIVIFFSVKALKDTNFTSNMTKEAQPPREIAEDMNNKTLADQDRVGVKDDRSMVDADSESVEHSDKLQYTQSSDAIGIQSDIVEVYVQDVCITPQTLKFMAINNELGLVESDEESVVIEIMEDEQRNILYNELSKMGEIKEVGENIGGNRIKIIIKSKSE